MATSGSRWPLRLLVTLFLLLSSLASAAPAPNPEAEALLTFKSTIADPNDMLRSWAPNTTPCVGRRSSWAGVFCDDRGNVIKLVLENMGLGGALDTGPLVGLRALRSLSFMNNNFEGAIPNVGAFVWLRTLYLSGNRLSGEIPDGEFSRMLALNKVHLARNGFSGPIPGSLTKVVRLVELMLEGNSFSGPIPEFRQKGLKANLSNNALAGSIPPALTDMDPSAFAGNQDLCGPPLGNPCKPTAPPPTPAARPEIPSEPPTSEIQSSADHHTTPRRRSTPNLAAIIAVSLLLLLALLVFVVARRRRDQADRLGRPPSSLKNKTGPLPSERPSPAHIIAGGIVGGKKAARDGDHGRLVFARERSERFELQDLLKASAEVLGSGSFGASYKAVLVGGTATVVKRFKEMNAVGREDFSEHMRRLGRLSHPNLLPLVAYYYRREEKLLVFDYVPKGSLAHMLHGNHDHPRLDWAARLRIVKGVARGLAYLHGELPMLSLPHGHLKSSNVLLSDASEPLLTDYALTPLTNRAHLAQVMVAYKAPEVVQTGLPTRKTDVWALGILIVEVMTGKFPASYLLQGNEGVDMAGWVRSVVGEDPTAEVLDEGMGGARAASAESEMMKLLRVGMGCCETEPGRRLELADAVERIEEVMEGEEEVEESSSAGESDSGKAAEEREEDSSSQK